MEELVKLVSQKTGLSKDMAKVAVDTVVGYLKDKLPDPIAGQVDGVLSGAGDVSDLGSIAQNLGGLFGKKE